MDICEECGFYREGVGNKDCKEERYCEWLERLVDKRNCKSIKYVFDNVQGNEYASREECCEYTKKLIKLYGQRIAKG